MKCGKTELMKTRETTGLDSIAKQQNCSKAEKLKFWIAEKNWSWWHYIAQFFELKQIPIVSIVNVITIVTEVTIVTVMTEVTMASILTDVEAQQPLLSWLITL